MPHRSRTLCSARRLFAMNSYAQPHTRCHRGNMTKGAGSATTQFSNWPGGMASAKQVMPTISVSGAQGRESSRCRRDQGRLHRKEDGSRALKLRQNSRQDLDGAKVEKAVSSFTNMADLREGLLLKWISPSASPGRRAGSVKSGTLQDYRNVMEILFFFFF